MGAFAASVRVAGFLATIAVGTAVALSMEEKLQDIQHRSFLSLFDQQQPLPVTTIPPSTTIASVVALGERTTA